MSAVVLPSTAALHLRSLAGSSAAERGHLRVNPGYATSFVIEAGARPKATEDQNPQKIAFRVQTALMPLVPEVPAALGVARGQPARLLVASAAGLFLLRRSAAAQGSADAARAEAVLRNLTETVTHVFDGRADRKSPGIVYRAAPWGLAVVDDLNAQHRVLSLQQALGTGPYPRFGALLSGRLSGSLLDVGDAGEAPTGTTLARAAAALGPRTKVEVQPLAGEWRVPRAALTATVAVAAVDAPTEPTEPFGLGFLLQMGSGDDASALGVVVEGQHSALVHAAPRPGDVPGVFEREQRERLERIVESCLRKELDTQEVQALVVQLRRPGDLASSRDALKRALDAAAARVAQSLQQDVQAAQLLAGGVRVQVNFSLEVAQGRTVHLPSGRTCVVPAYAADPTSARLSAYLGVLPSLGLSAAFRSWEATASGFPLN